MPDLLPENVDSWALWSAVQTQWRASAFGLIGLDYAAARCVADTMGLIWDEDALAMLSLLEAKELRAQSVAAKDKHGRNS